MASTVPVGEPYALDGTRLAFVSWRYVRPGTYAWLDASGKNVTVHGDQLPGEARLQLHDSPAGVRLVVHSAKRTRPVLAEQSAWEKGGFPVLTTILKDGSHYRAWGMINDWGDLKGRGPSYFCHYESDDGLNWRRPEAGIVDFNGSKNNNLLATEGGTVFIDPFAPASERYKWISAATYTPEQAKVFAERRTCGVDFKSNRTDAGHVAGVKGAVSPDGLSWKILPEPLAMMHSDTQVVAYYDARLRKYVGYFRDWAVDPRASAYASENDPGRWIGIGRRSIGRAETEDFREFPLSQIILEPPMWLPPSQVLYTNGRTAFPSAPEQHLMFPSIWDQSTDRTHVRLAVSSEGANWQWLGAGEPAATPVLDTNEPGTWDGGCLFASPNLIELPSGDFALPYTGYNVPHKYPRRRATRATGYATWSKGRLAGIHAPDKGSFSTIAVVPPTQKLLLNATTAGGGSIEIEAAELSGKPLPGRSFADCVPLSGDLHRAPVTWKSQDTLGSAAPVILRFKLTAATIYFVDFA